jgi:hypothetical protein
VTLLTRFLSTIGNVLVFIALLVIGAVFWVLLRLEINGSSCIINLLIQNIVKKIIINKISTVIVVNFILLAMFFIPLSIRYRIFKNLTLVFVNYNNMLGIF